MYTAHYNIKTTGITKSTVHCQHVRLAKASQSIVTMLVNTKDPVLQECWKGVVNLQLLRYVLHQGIETGRTLQLHMKEHKRPLADGDPKICLCWLSTQ